MSVANDTPVLFSAIVENSLGLPDPPKNECICYIAYKTSDPQEQRKRRNKVFVSLRPEPPLPAIIQIQPNDRAKGPGGPIKSSARLTNTLVFIRKAYQISQLTPPECCLTNN